MNNLCTAAVGRLCLSARIRNNFLLLAVWDTIHISHNRNTLKTDFSIVLERYIHAPPYIQLISAGKRSSKLILS